MTSLALASPGIGHNNPPPDEVLPPKALRVVDKLRARQIEIAARLLKGLFSTPIKHMMQKRIGGDEGRALRRFLILYARGLGAPVWECAMIFGLDRKQIGQEEASYLDMLARNEELETDAENLITMCDHGIKVETARFIRVSLSEIQAEMAAKRALKAAREAVDKLELPAPKPARAKPKPAEMTPGERRRQEAALLILKGVAERTKRKQEQDLRILNATIAAGEAPGATKTQRSDAASARKAKAEILASKAEVR